MIRRIIKIKFNLIFYGVITFFVGLVLIIVVYIFATEYTFTVNYSKDMLNVQQDMERNLTYEFVNKRISESKYLIDSYKDESGEKIGLIFINANHSISDMLNQESDYDNCVVVDSCLSVYAGNTIDLDIYNVPKQYKVYYTTYSFKKIDTASDKELEKIMNKSHLVYEHMNENTND